MREDPVRNASGVADLRYRAFWPEWEGILNIEFLSGALTAKQIVNLVNVAGWSSGVCEMRPQQRSAAPSEGFRLSRRQVMDVAPILHIGVDIAYKRDTSAVCGVYRHQEWNKHVLFCHKSWEPPVHIPAVTAYVRELLEKERVAGVWFDPHQWAAEAQRLAEVGMPISSRR